MEINNKIYLGDASQLIKQIPDNTIDAIYTDVPYLYENGGGGSSDVALRIKNNAQNLANANITDGFNYEIFNDFVRVLKKINVFIWCSKLQIPDILNWWINYGKNNNIRINYEILVWCKTNPTPCTNNVWLPDIEYCLYFREKGVKLNDGYDNKHKYYINGLNVADKNDYGHPTCKPLDFTEKHLLHCTQPGDLILDPFLGSGTTVLAAKHTNRKFLGFEINPEYYDIACKRINGENKRGELNLFDISYDE